MKDPKDFHTSQVDIIESTFDSFGIRSRVSEINDETDSYHYFLEIVMGTHIDDILPLDKDLSLALASVKPVKIIAPVKGRSMVCIIVPKVEGVPIFKEKRTYKILRIKEKDLVTFDNIERLRRVLSFVLVVLANGIIWIARKVDSEYGIVWQKNDVDFNTPLNEGEHNTTASNTDVLTQKEGWVHLVAYTLAFAVIARIGWLIYLDLSFGDTASRIFFFFFLMIPAVVSTYYFRRMIRGNNTKT